MKTLVRSSFAGGLGAAIALTLASCTSSPKQGPDREAEAREALRTVGLRVLGARSVAGDSVPYAPLAGDRLRLEDEDGPCEIRLRPGSGGLELVLLEHDRELVVATGVRPLTLGEKPNGMDDNGNGLIDEAGFSVVRERDTLSIWLSLVGPDSDDERVACVQTTLTLR